MSEDKLGYATAQPKGNTPPRYLGICLSPASISRPSNTIMQPLGGREQLSIGERYSEPVASDDALQLCDQSVAFAKQGFRQQIL
jgi:hypothetical protein